MTSIQRELHTFRGLEKQEPGFIMGHEFTGTVTEVGAAVKTVKVGDKIVTPFTTSWYVPHIVLPAYLTLFLVKTDY